MKLVVFALMFAMLLLSIVNVSAAKPEKFRDVLIGFETGKYDPDVVAKAGGHVKKDLRPLVHAIAAKIPERLVELFEQNPAVKYVEEDAVAFIVGHTVPPSLEYANSQGVDHIEADVVHSAGKNLGSGFKTVQVKLDSGAYATATPMAPDWSSWSINVKIGSTGSHRILSRVTDNAGNQSWNSVIITAQ